MDLNQALTEAIAAVPIAPDKGTVATAPKATPQATVTQEPDITIPEDQQDNQPEPEQEQEQAPAPDLPEGYVAPAVIDGTLATDFVIRDEQGELEVPNLIIEYKANGKVRKDRLDQVVKMAQWGVYNTEREQRVQQSETQMRTLLEEREAFIQELESRERELEMVLTDDDYLFKLRDAFDKENTPEVRARRAEEQVNEMRVAQQMQAIAQQGQQFYGDTVRPALDMIAKALPTVSPDELEERMSYALSPQLAKAPNGQAFLPASRFDYARQYIINDLAIWAQMLHAQRSEGGSPVKGQAGTSSELDRARIEAQKAKRALGNATRPVGRAAMSSTATPPKSNKNATVDDAMSSALSNVLSAFR